MRYAQPDTASESLRRDCLSLSRRAFASLRSMTYAPESWGRVRTSAYQVMVCRRCNGRGSPLALGDCYSCLPGQSTRASASGNHRGVVDGQVPVPNTVQVHGTYPSESIAEYWSLT